METRFIGDTINYVAILFIAVATASAMLDTPKIFDPLWKKVGFCVSDDPNRSIDTEILCALFLTTSGISLYFFAQSRPKGGDELAQMRLQSGAFSNVAHGVGHLFVYYAGGPPPAVEFKWDPMAIANIVMLFFFFAATLRTLMQVAGKHVPILLAIATIVCQAILKVPPELSFTYSQSVILLSGIVDQLLLDNKRKGFSYVLIALQYVPTLVLYGFESLQCQKLASFGGHAIYDFYLSVVPFALYYAVASYDASTSEKKQL